MRLAVALTGSLREALAAEMAAGERAVSAAMRAAGDAAKADFRAMTVAGGLGARLAKTWRSETYPRGRPSLGAAALVWSKAPKLMRAFDEGALIRGKDGLWLAIPTENAPKRGVGGKRIAPSTFPEASLGRLRFVYRRGNSALLVVDDLRARRGKRGGFARATDKARASGRGLTTVVMFTLVRQARLRKRVDIASVAEKWGARLPGLVLDAWERESAGA